MTCVTGSIRLGQEHARYRDPLQKSLKEALPLKSTLRAALASIEGIEFIDKVIDIDQSPIGRTPRSNPATYTGALHAYKRALQPTAGGEGSGDSAPDALAFNVKGGRCETCRGEGVIKVEMHFLPDVYVHCDQCASKRYNRDTLEISYKGQKYQRVPGYDRHRSAGIFLETSPTSGPSFRLSMTWDWDISGSASPRTTLSGGEAQRVKLTKELSKRATGRTVYILDEPTTGLHFADIHKLLDVLKSLRDNGNTIIIIEHNLDVIKSADYVIDLGPEGGKGGGKGHSLGNSGEGSEVKAIIYRQISFKGS